MVIPFPTAAPPTPDAPAREAALDTTQSCIVEAPAGSGKTGLLIQRFLKLLASVEQPGEVLALTFTNKATAEMQERILAALRKTADGTAKSETEFDRLTRDLALRVLERDSDRNWQLLHRPHLLNIRTIDSLCGEIARSVPLLSGEAGVATPVPDASRLYARAAHAVMMQFGGSGESLNDAVRTVLLHRDGDLLFCERVLGEMLQTREQWGSLVPLGDNLTEEHLETVTLPRLNAALARTVCAALTDVRDVFDEDALAEIARIAERLAYGPGHGNRPNPFVVCTGRTSAPGCTAEDLDHWQAIAQLLLAKDKWRASFNVNLVGTTLEKADKQRLQELIDTHSTPELYELLDAVRAFDGHHYPSQQWKVAKALFRLLERALIELRLLFAREEVCDFTEVALAARAAIRDGAGDVQSSLGTRLQHLLVDEMQDTSSGQYELLQTLTAGWDGSGQTVFLVGDPKQSIYLFRQARVDRFQQCMKDARLGDVPLQVLRLTTNFRSGSALVESFNEAFTRIFPSHAAPEGDVDFQPAVPSKEGGEPMDWHAESLPKQEELAANRRVRRQALRREARTIARTVEQWRATHSDGAAATKIAVLTRARSHVTEIAKALRKHRIPYRAIDLESLAEQQEVLDALAITRALLHPADRTAWLALLRAPWCGLALNHLHTLLAGDARDFRRRSLRPILRERCALLPAPDAARTLRTLDVMDAALRHTAAESLADRVDRTWHSLGGHLCTTSVEAENVRQFLRVLDAMENEGAAINLHTLTERLEKLFAQPDHAPDAVDIMTIHRSKGLEWDLVILPGLHRVAGRDAYSALDWLELPTTDESGTPDVLLAPLPDKGGEAGALLNYIRSRKRTRVQLELKRLFYVAATRARTSLHLFAWPQANREANRPTISKGTLLHAALGQNKEQDFAALMQPALDAMTPEAPLALAASAADLVEGEPKPVGLPPIRRLPDSVDPIAFLYAAQPSAAIPNHGSSPAPQRFERPQGSFGARAVGNAIHAFLERVSEAVAKELVTTHDAEAVLDRVAHDVTQWSGAIHAMLRSGGLPPGAVERAAATVERALLNTLRSEDGRWLLLPHRLAANESAWRSGAGAEGVRVRLDRSFFAGSQPGLSGNDTMWIVDFKTADRASAEQNAFLEEERLTYEQQLRTYATIRLQTLPADTPVMLAMFYPLMGRLIWWKYEANPRPAAAGPVACEEEDTPAFDGKGQFSLFG
jgi:ATP-dependent exoDNAse (exonuclease V) beta subunit